MNDIRTVIRWVISLGGVFTLATGLFLLGLAVGKTPTLATERAASVDAATGDGDQAKAQYACSMFCVPPLDDPGKCPICGMEMVEVGASSRRLTLSPEARRLAEVRTARVKRQFVSKTIRLVGKVAIDETQLHQIVAPADGFVRTLRVGFAGISVREGDEMLEFRSDAVLEAQRSLLAARAAFDAAPPAERRAAQTRLGEVRKTLIDMGVAGRDALAIERSGKATDHIMIRAPKSARVMKTHAAEGMWVEVGTPIYTMGRIGGLWVMLDAYESDLAWLRLGQEVGFELDARPGTVISGKIAFIAPVIDPKSRTAKVRVSAEVRLGASVQLVPNRGGMMKVGMFVRARVKAQLGEDGSVLGPMDVEETEPPLVIPATAPLLTGKRAIVYVAEKGSAGTYEGREVVLGPRADDHYVVLAGLHEGERVVTHGAFKIDSAIQIRGGPSMMNPEQLGTEDDGPRPQTLCPVMGREIRRDLLSDYDGRRVYFCCEQCIPIFAMDPKTYVNQMERDGIILARTPSTQAICPILGRDVVEEHFADHDGKRIYFCSAACVAQFKKNPQPILDGIAQKGITLPEAPKRQTHCPVMGKAIVPDVFTDYEGKRIYFCCPPCIPRFNADPTGFMDKMREQNIELADTPPENGPKDK